MNESQNARIFAEMLDCMLAVSIFTAFKTIKLVFMLFAGESESNDMPDFRKKKRRREMPLC